MKIYRLIKGVMDKKETEKNKKIIYKKMIERKKERKKERKQERKK